MNNCGMRQMEEKHVANQVDLMVWSNRLDLLALSNFKGEVQVYRLWQKVWALSPSQENDLVRAMAWRPDGKALAIGYSSGLVCVVDIEDKEILHKINLDHHTSEEFDSDNRGVTCITWPVRAGVLKASTEYNVYDDASIFLSNPQVDGNYKNEGTEEKCKEIKETQEQTQLNILMIAYGTGYIHMSIFGRFPFDTINLADIRNDNCGEYKVLDMIFSDDFSVLQVIYVDKGSNHLSVALINTSILSAYAEDVFTVANKHSQIVQLVSSLDQTMTSVSEAWEHILLEMDTKMADYAASVPEGGVSADFLELLMMGVPPMELELFLLQEITAKGLKKFGSSVELSYSTIQKLVLRQLNIVGQSLTYYLAELRGITRIPDRFKIMELEESKVTEAIKASFAFLNKCLELQQVIDVSMRNYKAFFRWLFVVIVRLLEEQTPSEIVKITQQELTHIAEFLYNFYNVKEGSANSSGKPVQYNLERLGQYLQNEDLTILPDEEENSWHKFLEENPCLTKDDTIFSVSQFKKFSLVQQQNHLKDAIEKVFDTSKRDIGNSINLLYNIKCFDNRNCDDFGDNFRVTQIFDDKRQQFLIAVLDKCSRNFLFASVSLKENDCSAVAMLYHFSPSLVLKNENGDFENLVLQDLQFYSTEYLSILSGHPQNSDCSIFIQLPIKVAIDNCVDLNVKSRSTILRDKIASKDISQLLNVGVFKVLEKMDGYQMAVSGARKVSVILSNSRRRVRVFEMEVDGQEDEDETLDTTPQSHNTTQRSDTSQNTSDHANASTEDINF